MVVLKFLTRYLLASQIPGGQLLVASFFLTRNQPLVTSIEVPHQVPASQVPGGQLLVCSNASPLGHIGF